MSYALEPVAFRAEASERAAFIRRTYGHLAGAVLAFVAIEFALLSLPGIDTFILQMVRSPVSWLVVMAGFVGVSMLAEMWAKSDTSRGLQYLGLSLYTVAEAIIFLPLMYVAVYLTNDRTILPTAGILTLCVFGGLSVAVLTTRKDFSFLRPILCMGGFLLLGAILAFTFIGGFTFGLVIAFAAVGLACVAILYHTSNVVHHYRTDQHVAAALALFASVALLFYYILLILLNSSSRE